MEAVASKSRLRQEYASNAPHREIVAKLNEEGLGRKIKGEIKPWTQAQLSKEMCSMGLRRSRLFTKGDKRKKQSKKAKRMAASRQGASRSKDALYVPASATDKERLIVVKGMLNLPVVDAATKVKMALMVLEA